MDNYEKGIRPIRDVLAFLKTGDRDSWNKYRLDNPQQVVDLSNIDLRGRSLKMFDLSRCILRCANLYNADLSFCDLRHADLSGADLRYANLRCATLTSATVNHICSTATQSKTLTMTNAIYDIFTLFPYDFNSQRYDMRRHNSPVIPGLCHVARDMWMKQTSFAVLSRLMMNLVLNAIYAIKPMTLWRLVKYLTLVSTAIFVWFVIDINFAPSCSYIHENDRRVRSELLLQELVRELQAERAMQEETTNAIAKVKGELEIQHRRDRRLMASLWGAKGRDTVMQEIAAEALEDEENRKAIAFSVENEEATFELTVDGYKRREYRIIKGSEKQIELADYALNVISRFNEYAPIKNIVLIGQADGYEILTGIEYGGRGGECETSYGLIAIGEGSEFREGDNVKLACARAVEFKRYLVEKRGVREKWGGTQAKAVVKKGDGFRKVTIKVYY